MREEVIRSKFPGLRDVHLKVTSPPDHIYNCMAWAAGDSSAWWSPEDIGPGVFVWPAGVPREATLPAWLQVFSTLGYQPCENGEVDPGFEKIAIFANEGVPCHVARQLPSGLWTSKLGTMEDIEHDLDGLVGERYGSVVAFLRRPTAP